MKLIQLKKISLYILILVCVNFFIFLGIANGQDVDMQTKTSMFAAGAGLKSTSPGILIVNIIRIALSILATIFLVLIIISGFQWMTSGGDNEKIKKARSRIINAVIGLAIIAFSYVITSLIFSLINYKPGTGLGSGYYSDDFTNGTPINLTGGGLNY